MKIYLDLLFILNYLFDFMLLLSTNILLKRGIKISRLLLVSILSSITMVVLFVPLNTITLLLIKLLLGILIIILSFKYNNFKYFINNLITFYILSFILGGFMYYLKLNYNNPYLIFIVSPLILYIYIKQNKEIKQTNYYREIKLYLDNKCYILRGFIDTGNKLKYLNKLVIITNNKNIINDSIDKEYIFIPYKTINTYAVIKSIKVSKVIIDNKVYKNIFLGLTNKKIKKGADVILNSEMI